MKTSLKRISSAQWLDHLASPQSRLRVRLSEVPSRYRTPLEWDTRPRHLEEHLVYFFAQESARAEIAGKTFLCPRGSCCWVTPGTTFRFISDQTPLVWRFRFSLTRSGTSRPLAPGKPFYFLPNTPAAAETVNALLLELEHDDHWRPAALRSWLMQLSILFFRAAATTGRLRTLTPPQQKALTTLVENARPEQWLQPRDLARAAGLTLDYFTRVFRRSHDVSPRHWLVRQRLAYAVVLLQETPLRVGEIAQRLGYANPHLFSRQFTACYGRSPRSFRQ